jgi:hypothetical protein
MLKKIDDSNIRLWVEEENRRFAGDGFKLSYCGPDVQRAYATQDSKK